MIKTRPRSHYYFALIVLIFAAFLVRLIPIDISYFFWDEAVYMLHGAFFGGNPIPYSELNFRPPLVPVFLSASYYLSVDPELWARIIMALANSLFALLVFLFGSEFKHNGQPKYSTGLLAATIVAFLPFSIIASKWVLTDSLAALLSGFSVYFALLSWKGTSLKKGVE